LAFPIHLEKGVTMSVKPDEIRVIDLKDSQTILCVFGNNITGIAEYQRYRPDYIALLMQKLAKHFKLKFSSRFQNNYISPRPPEGYGFRLEIVGDENEVLIQVDYDEIKIRHKVASHEVVKYLYKLSQAYNSIIDAVISI
jgi:hypothetical protein